MTQEKRKHPEKFKGRPRSRWPAIFIALTAMLLLATICLGLRATIIDIPILTPTIAHPTPFGGSNIIAFTSVPLSYLGRSVIYVINADGSNPAKITDNPEQGGEDYDPEWSPDGQRIAFVSNSSLYGHVYLMNADGSNVTMLTAAFDWTYEPRWSPDGKHIAFVGKDTFGPSHIFVVNTDSSFPVDLNHPINPPYSDDLPAWSPDSRHIVFVSNRSHQEIYKMNADGTDPIRLSNSPQPSSNPVWSPDGQHIAFVTIRSSDGDPEIYAMNADGSNVTRLSTNLTNGAYAAEPTWSPDGQHIAFVSTQDGPQEIYVMNADGTHQVRLTHSSCTSEAPTWSPDSQHIAFDSYCNGYRIYVMNADGSNLFRLTDTLPYARFPVWRP